MSERVGAVLTSSLPLLLPPRFPAQCSRALAGTRGHAAFIGITYSLGKHVLGSCCVLVLVRELGPGC